MTAGFSLAVSALALFVSGLTAWLTLFRRGTVKMTQPTVIYFGKDSGGYGPPKVFLRTLLFATAKKGRVIQSLHATLTKGETRQNFNIWVYGDKSLLRGSGLFVGETGIAANHHFMTTKDATEFQFTAGRYRLDIVAQLVGDKATVTLLSEALEITPDLAQALDDQHTGLYFDWGPDSKGYIPHLDKKGPAPTPSEILESIERHRSDDE